MPSVGKAELKAPISDAAISNHLIHYQNVAYRIGKSYEVCTETGKIFDREAMKLWGREYQPGWEPVL
jgi:hypothetical protein